MSGHVVARKRRWPWAILSLLFAVALAWSFAVTADGRIILQIGMGAGLVLSLLRLTLTSRSSRRARRAQEADEGTEAEADESQPAADGHGPTYEEVFGTQVELDTEGLPLAPEEEDWSGEEAEVETEMQRSAEQPPEEPTPTSEEDPQPVPADLQEAVDQVEPGGDGDEFQEHLRRMREEFRARAEEAAARVKQREAELHEAASVADQER
jgi:hypothetical protein